MKQAARIQSTDKEHPVSPVEAVGGSLHMKASPSPARALQRRLELSMPDLPRADGGVAERWPPYARTGFILLSAASLWAAIIAVVNVSLG